MDKELSFSATVLACGQPINCLGAMSEGPVIVDSPNIFPPHGLEGSQALGMLNGSDSDWDHGQETGLITFSKGAAPSPILLYFRHSAAGYRLYVRNGPYLGHGIFRNANGLVEAQPIGRSDPTAWRITDAQSAEPFDLSLLERDQVDILMSSAEGDPLGLQALYPVGGYLACHDSASACSLSLLIENRQVDWLARD